MTKEYYIAWWNVENLFDVDQTVGRVPYLEELFAETENSKDWTEVNLNLKISQLAKIIKTMNNGKGPDILGLCEIENKSVLEKLVTAIKKNGVVDDDDETLDDITKRKYQIAHHNCSDKRGIDVAFIYDEDIFTNVKQEYHVIIKRYATRDIFQVHFETNSNNKFVVIGNHWPARTGGVYKTEPYRIVAGETLAYYNAQLQKEEGKDHPILIMGDFNDNPYDRSLMDYALSTQCEDKVKAATTAPRLYNLMWNLQSQGLGTYYYDANWNMLDQFMVSKGFLENSKFTADVNSVEILSKDMHDGTTKKLPRRFGGFKKKIDKDGFSDHFPIKVIVKEAI